MTPALAGGRWPALRAAALSLALFVAPWFVPILGAAVSLLTPVPLALAYWFSGLDIGRKGLALAGLGAVLLILVLPSGGGLAYLCYYLALAWALGEGPYHRWDAGPNVAYAALAALVGLGVLLTVAGVIDGQGPMALVATHWQGELDAVVQGYRQMGLEEAQVAQLQASLEATGQLLIHLAPGVMVAGSLILAWLNWLVIYSVAQRKNRAPVYSPPLNQWRAPDRLIWLVVVTGALLLVGQGWLRMAGANLALPLTVVYFFQGAAVLAFWLQKKNAPRWLRVLVFVLIAVELFLAVGVAMVGLFDLWFNFRRLPGRTA